MWVTRQFQEEHFYKDPHQAFPPHAASSRDLGRLSCGLEANVNLTLRPFQRLLFVPINCSPGVVVCGARGGEKKTISLAHWARGQQAPRVEPRGLWPRAPPPELGGFQDRGQGRPQPGLLFFPVCPASEHLHAHSAARNDPIPGCEREAGGGAGGGGMGRGGSGDWRGPPEGPGEKGAFSGRAPRKGTLRGRVGPRTRRLQGPTGARLPGDRAVDPRAESQGQGSLRARRTHHGLPQRGHPTVRVQCRLRAPCPHARVRRRPPPQNLGFKAAGVRVGVGGRLVVRASPSPSAKTLLGP